MKAISLWQPWASAMALGWKKNETRHWQTNYRGPLLIHAAKKVVGWPNMDMQAAFDEIGVFLPSDLPRGVILCKVDLVDCKRILVHNRPEGFERACGDYTLGRWMWITDNLRSIEFNQFRGSQGFFEVPDELIKEV